MREIIRRHTQNGTMIKHGRPSLLAFTLLLLLASSTLPHTNVESAVAAALCRRTPQRHIVQAHGASDTGLVEMGRAANLSHSAKVPSEIKIVSYNSRWRGGDDLRKLIQLLKQDPEIGEAAIIGLQEVDRNKKRTRHVNTIKLIADDLGKHYAWAAPPTAKPNQEEETGVAILSSYPLTDVQRIVLPHAGPGERRRVAIGATVSIPEAPLRFYSVHSENRMSVEKKLEQTKAVL
ncbi:MAG: endonuclease/exonuclease/phosphatase family protein, partial [Pyrinomonadaceae bacterium]